MSFEDRLPEELAESLTPLLRPQPFELIDDQAARARLMNFESLGFNCEFGLLQRRYGAEPLGLFRWPSVIPAHLIAMLNNGFAGYGDPEWMAFNIAPWGEILLNERKYHTHRHTFVLEKDVDIDTFIGRECRRLAFLREKLISDLRDAEKIFVYHFMERIERDEISQIHAGIRRLGDADLLIVKIADDQHGAGTVEACDDGLFLGYIDRFGDPRPGRNDAWDISFDSWMAVIDQLG